MKSTHAHDPKQRTPRTHSTKAPHPKAGLDPQPSLSQQHLLQLQRTIGNRAVASLAGIPKIQRMPTRAAVIEELGKPHMDIKLFGFFGPTVKHNSTRYRTLLDALDAFHAYTRATTAGMHRGEVMDRLARVLELQNTIIAACAEYEGEEGAKGEYFRKLKVQAQNEKTDAISAMVQYSNNLDNVPQFVRQRKTVADVLLTVAPSPTMLNESDFSRTVGGGLNQLRVYNQGGKEKYFKENTSTISTDTTEIDNALVKAYEAHDQEEIKRLAGEQSAMITLAEMTEQAGISRQDAHMANRDVALYRLDQLLGANVIARTQFALRQTQGGPVLGSLMEGAKGERAGDLGKQGKLAPDATEKANRGGNTINVQDPNLQRLLSRLQMLDTLAFQIDRNTGNYFIQFDQQGNVIGITGIDNDMGFGTKTNIEIQTKEYPGFSRYVDKEIAQAIISIDERLVVLTLSDLLSVAELDAFAQRLRKLKLHLAQLDSQGRLLTPQQWDQMTAATQKSDVSHDSGMPIPTSYFGKLAKDVG
jgi:hypothetical protein